MIDLEPTVPKLMEPPWTVDLPHVADLVMLACAASALYLGACSEPPPMRRRGSVQLVRPAMRRNSSLMEAL